MPPSQSRSFPVKMYSQSSATRSTVSPLWLDLRADGTSALKERSCALLPLIHSLIFVSHTGCTRVTRHHLTKLSYGSGLLFCNMDLRYRSPRVVWPRSVGHG